FGVASHGYYPRKRGTITGIVKLPFRQSKRKTRPRGGGLPRTVGRPCAGAAGPCGKEVRAASSACNGCRRNPFRTRTNTPQEISAAACYGSPGRGVGLTGKATDHGNGTDPGGPNMGIEQQARWSWVLGVAVTFLVVWEGLRFFQPAPEPTV